ncbi:MAG: DUF4349 domain-containing protein [Acidimicrobiales bacterium]
MAIRHGSRFLAAAAALLLVLAACGADGDDDTSSSGDGAGAFDEGPYDDGGDAGSDDGAASDDGSSGSGAVATGTSTSGVLSENATLTSQSGPGTVGRSIVFTGSITVEVENLVSAGERTAVATEALGGFVAAEQSGFDDHPSTVLTLRVPPEGFRSLLGRLGDLGEVRSQSVDSSDVTERVVDLESRISTADVSVARLREFLAGATTTSDVRELEAELVSRETELEQLRGELRSVESRVSLSTIVATLVPLPDDPPAAPGDDDAPLPGFAEALGGGWDAFRRIGSGLVVGVLAALPFLGVAVVVSGAVVTALRRRRPPTDPPGPVPAARAAVTRP